MNRLGQFRCHSERLPDAYENEELIDLWTSNFLQGFERPSTSPKRISPKSKVVFGRTTYPNAEADKSIRPRTAPGIFDNFLNNDAGLGRRTQRESLFRGTKLSDSRAFSLQKQRMLLSEPARGQESKFKGRQIHTFKIDHSKAREKRIRQLQYSREIRSGSKTLKGREIDSITRVVVQSFRKLIDCERCALFLMDDSANELYFKPVGDIEHSSARLKEIRFPASSGVAGWVASNKKMLNIKNAYHDPRFNPEIDKVTGFRTRTILCHPVLSSSNVVLGVIQMVNKKKGDAKELRDKAKKKKSDETNKGYQSCFEHFSVEDEEVLEKCCRQVSKSLEEVVNQRSKEKNESKIEEVASSFKISNKPFQPVPEIMCSETNEDETSIEQSTISDSIQYQDSTRRNSTNSMRRSSLGSLVQFIKRNSNNEESVAPKQSRQNYDMDSSVDDIVLGEAIQKYKFRATTLMKVQQLDMECRLNDPDYQAAQAKRKRMTEYNKGQRRK